MMLNLAFGSSEKSNTATNRDLDWDELKDVLSDVKVRSGTRAFMMTGSVPGNVRAPIEQTQLLMLDLDNKNGSGPLSFDALLWDLESSFDYNWAAYTTRSYDGDNVHYRVVIPFAEPLSREYHKAAVQHVLDLLPESVTQYFDGCSYRPDQIMFLPAVSVEGAPFLAESGGDLFFNPAALSLEADNVEVLTTVVDDIEIALASQPLDLSVEEVKQYLELLDPCTLSYGGDEGVFGWVDVGMALAHQFQKSDEGLRLWVEWSRRNTEVHKDKGMRAKWRSFNILPRGGRRGITFASVIKVVKDQGGLMSVSVPSSVEVLEGDGDVSKAAEMAKTKLDSILEEASGIDCVMELSSFCKTICDYSRAMLPDYGREMIAQRIVEGFGKDNGITKKSLVKMLTPTRKAVIIDDRSRPDWMAGWCYIEKTEKYYHLPTDHAIGPAAINAKFTRMDECSDGEGGRIPAAHLMSVTYKIPTAADTMYWPGQESIFEHNGLKFVNAYISDGVPPAETICDEGQRAIDLMLYHIGMLIDDEREVGIVLDWLTYVYQNPGKRINWSIMLQGAQGIGKSYIGVVMGRLLGRNVRQLDPSAIVNQFTGWAHGSTLTIIEEMRISGSNKFAIVDRMKQYITNETIQIEEKGRDHRTVMNFTNYLIFTNHKDAIPVNDGDRRYCVIYSDIQSEVALDAKLGGKENVEKHFDQLFSDVRTHAASLAAYFESREVGADFNPNGRAPSTRALATIKRLSKSADSDLLDDAICEFECGAICNDYVDVTWLQKLAKAEDFDLPKTSSLSAILRDAGFEPTVNRTWIASTRKNHTVWFHPDRICPDEAEARVRSFQNKEDFNQGEFERLQKPFDASDLPF